MTFPDIFSILWNCTRFTPVICELCSIKVFSSAEINVNHPYPPEQSRQLKASPIGEPLSSRSPPRVGA